MNEKVTQARIKRNPSLDAGEKLQPPHVLIAVPAYAGQMYQTFVEGLINLRLSLMHSGVMADTYFLGNESLIPRGRNKCVQKFLNGSLNKTLPPYTHLLFIDADIGFRARDVDMMIRGEFDVTCAPYPMKAVAWKNIGELAREGVPDEDLETSSALYVINCVKEDVLSGKIDVLEKNGARFTQVMEGGTGFMLISRRAIEKFLEHYGRQKRCASCGHDPSIAYASDYSTVKGGRGSTMWNVFHADIFHHDPEVDADGYSRDPGRYLSEDYWFCQKWRAIGGEVWLALDTNLNHTGTHTFNGNIRKVFETEDASPKPQSEKSLDEIYSAEWVKEYAGLEPEFDVIAESLVEFFNPKKVWDVCCGPGLLIGALRNSPLSVDAFGFDGSAACVASAHPMTRRFIEHADVREITASPTTDLVTCTEVAEHMDAKDAPHLVKVLCSAGAPIVFTAAPPGQPGNHHVNCQPKEYWLALFWQHSFRQDMEATAYFQKAWADLPRQPWLAKNVMVLRHA